MFEGIVLAAGRSRRAGGFKPAHLHRGRPLLLHALDGLAPWCARLIVVAGHRGQETAALVTGIPGLALVVNPDPDAPMFSSVRLGAGAVDARCEGFFVLPADCPLSGAKVPGDLIAAFHAARSERAVVPEYAGRGGHPVLLPRAARQAILQAPAHATLREVIARIGRTPCAVDEPAVLMDLDTREDLHALDARSLS